MQRMKPRLRPGQARRHENMKHPLLSKQGHNRNKVSNMGVTPYLTNQINKG